MSLLAARTGSINLGQGFPDTDGPPEVAEAAIAAIRAGHNQYPPGPGLPALRQAIADHQRRCYGLEHDPDTDVVVTMGATEAIAAAVLGLCEPGDEVVTLEPYYDSYAATIAMAGAHAPGRHPAGPRLRPRPRRPGRRRRPEDPADPAQLPAQPDRPGALGRRAGRRRPDLRRARPPGRHRRGLRAPRLRRAPHPPGHPAGDGGAHRHDLQPRQDVLLHRLEGRLGLRSGRPHRRRPHRQAVPVVLRGDAVPARRRRRPRAASAPTTTTWPRD